MKKKTWPSARKFQFELQRLCHWGWLGWQKFIRNVRNALGRKMVMPSWISSSLIFCSVSEWDFYLLYYLEAVTLLPANATLACEQNDMRMNRNTAGSNHLLPYLYFQTSSNQKEGYYLMAQLIFNFIQTENEIYI